MPGETMLVVSHSLVVRTGRTLGGVFLKLDGESRHDIYFRGSQAVHQGSDIKIRSVHADV